MNFILVILACGTVGGFYCLLLTVACNLVLAPSIANGAIGVEQFFILLGCMTLHLSFQYMCQETKKKQILTELTKRG